YGGTYFPPEDKWGRPGLKTVLRSIAQSWKSRRQEVLRSSQSLTETIQADAAAGSAAPLTTETLDAAVRALRGQYDPTHGGFGPAPKFPRSHSVSFLLRAWSRTKDPKTLEMVETTLDAMARGGIHDHLGGGFHRYSTDGQWLVPHFEKMLYDQALLARTYLEAYQVTGKQEYADVARGIFEYVLRDMRDPSGAFQSAEDAGEVGKEGEYYVWKPQEIEAILGAEEARWFNRFYGVTPGGNFENGVTILSIESPVEEFAQREKLSVEEIRRRLDAARRKLLAARNGRRRPHRDDKILADWNGLMIGALSYGAQVLDEPRYAQAARDAAVFLLDRMQLNGRLLHRYRDGEASIPAFLDDYAFLGWGLLDLYEATFEVRWLAKAQRLTREMVTLFWDAKAGGLFLSGEHNERLVAQTKELYDGALPSGNSVAALNLVRLGQLTMDKEFQANADRMFEVFSGQATQASHAFPQFLIALDFRLGPSQEVVIAGDPSDPQTRRMIRAVHERFLPRAVLALHPEDASAAQVEVLVPFLKAQRSLGGKPTAYVCQNYVCSLPTTEVATMTSRLDESS
ncbi:MAG: thioredoxin domain-containing protein, partial [Candidatus Omnitrophica bacterium]|nr:thioredoxin domain-containing protein [Candidatus Omnitrophota bacterium]